MDISPRTAAAIEGILTEAIVVDRARGEPTFAVLDFDNTLVKNDIMEAVLAYVCEHKLIRHPGLLGKQKGREVQGNGPYNARIFEHYYGLLDEGKHVEAYAFAPQVLAGFTQREVEGIVELTLKEEGTEPCERILYGRRIAHGIQPRPAMLHLVKRLKEEGIDPWIVSASPRAVVEPMRDKFYPGCEVIALDLEQERGAYTRRVVWPAPVYEGKVACIRSAVHPTAPPVLGVGDSLNDEPMLRYAAVRLVVDRSNAFTRLAREERWHVI